jgi:hypothetical protein
MAPEMEAACSIRTPVNINQTTCPHIPEDSTLQTHCCENLKSDISQRMPSSGMWLHMGLVTTDVLEVCIASSFG